MLTVSDEQFEELTKEACNPNRTERLSGEHLAYMENYIEKFSTSCFYTHKISVDEPFTEKVRKSMTENVKMSACATLLGPNYHDRVGSNDGKCANVDQEIYNFARGDLFKNASTRKPAKLNKRFAKYVESIGQISCGSVRGTCFLLTKELVITNYHVYKMMRDERIEVADFSLPITVSFDYFDRGQTQKITSVEVDEEQDKDLASPHLDYKLFRLKPNEGLHGRVPLGPKVRNFQLADGRVVIIGHPGGKEMQDEVCIAVGCCADREAILANRHKKCIGIHMTSTELLFNREKYQNYLSYDTSFFCGSSGSPVFDMNGNIVAMHTQGYLLEEKEKNVPNQEQEVIGNQMTVPNRVQEHDSREKIVKKYSLMEFGIQFCKICQHIGQFHGENVVRKIFSPDDEKPMDQT